MPQKTIRNIENLHGTILRGNGVKRAFANAITQGDVNTVRNTDIAVSWFDQPWDNHGNKLVAFAAKIALQRSPVKTSFGLSPHAQIFKILATKSNGYEKSLFTTAKNLKHYSVLHVIGNHNKSKGQDASHLLAILEQVAPKEALKKAFVRKYDGLHLPHKIAQQRGDSNLGRVIKKYASRAKNDKRSNNSNNNNNARTTPRPPQVNQAAVSAMMEQFAKVAIQEETKKLQDTMRNMMGQFVQQAETVANRAFDKAAEKELGVGIRKKRRQSSSNPYRFRTTPGRTV